MDVGCGRGEELAAEAAPTRAGMLARATKPRACGRRWPASRETRIMHKSRTGRFSREPTPAFSACGPGRNGGGGAPTNWRKASANGNRRTAGQGKRCTVVEVPGGGVIFKKKT